VQVCQYIKYQGRLQGGSGRNLRPNWAQGEENYTLKGEEQTDNFGTMPRQHVYTITVKSADFEEHWSIKMKYAHIIVSVFVHKK